MKKRYPQTKKPSDGLYWISLVPNDENPTFGLVRGDMVMAGIAGIGLSIPVKSLNGAVFHGPIDPPETGEMKE